MPTLEEAIQVNLATAVASIPVRSYGNIAIVGDDSSYATKNTPKWYYNQVDVETDHGTSSKEAIAAKDAFAQGVSKVCIVTTTAGAPTDFTNALDSLLEEDVQIIVPAGITNVTQLDQDFKAWCDTNEKILCVTNDNADSVSTITTNATTLASKHVFFVAYKEGTSGHDIAAIAAGVLATLKPWHTAMWRAVSGIAKSAFTNSEVKTLENGNVNAIIEVGGNVVISNGLCTQSSTKFIDVTRTSQWLKQNIVDDLAVLRLNSNKIPYSPRGLEVIRGSLIKTCERGVFEGALREDYVDDNGDLVKGYVVTLPTWESIPSGDKSNRVLNNVNVTAYLAGDIHSISLDLTISM
jgi:hypothetical protein